MIILDTNVISELARPRPDPTVLTWANGEPLEQLYATAISEAEILYGLNLLVDGPRREALRRAVLTMFGALFAGRVLPFDRAAAAEYGAWAGDRRRAGRPAGMADLQIASIARARGAQAIVTRNTKDFEGCGVTLVDPWQPV